MRSDPDVVYIGFILGHGGDALQLLDLAIGVSARGGRVRIVVPDLPTTVKFGERCRAHNLQVVRTPLIDVDMHHSRQSLFSLLRVFHAHRAPIVHIHTGDVCLPRLAILAMDILRLPRVIVTSHSPYDTLDPAGRRARFWASAARRRIHVVVSPSVHGRATQLSYGVPEDRAATIHNGVDTGRYGSGSAEAARAALGVGPEARLVVFTSRIDAQKRPLEAVQAFARIAGEFPDALLVFVGSGDHDAAVLDEAQRLGVDRRVRMVGYQSNVPDWLAAASVWILPTESENFSLAVLEAFAAGCPILSTLCPGNDEILRNGENSVAVPVGDVDGLTDGLRRLLGDETLRTRLGAAARAESRNFAVDVAVEKYIAKYREMAEAPWMGARP